MAFGNGTNWVVWSTGAAGNGGGFNPGNANFATDGAITTGTGNSPVLSSASYNFVAGDVAAWIFFPTAGTSIAGWYQIASVASNQATLSAAIGAACLLGTGGGAMNFWPTGASTVAGCNTVASPTGVTWGVDYSQQAAAKVAFTDMVIDGTTNTDFTSAANPVKVNMIGNIVNVTSGTGFTVQRVEVVSIPSGVIGRCDKSLGTLSSTGGNGALGGATAILTTTSPLFLAGNYCKLRATATYTLGATWTMTGAVKGDTTNGHIVLEGYTTIPAARDGRPTITSSTNSVHLITLNDNDYWEFRHLKLTHTAATRGAAFVFGTSLSTPVWMKDLIVGTIAGSDGCIALINNANFASVLYMEGVEIAGATSAVSAITNNPVFFGGLYLFGCYIHDSTAAVYKSSNTAVLVNCQDSIFYKNVGGFDFSSNTTSTVAFTSHYCTYVDNTGDCLKLGNSTLALTIELESNIVWNTTGWWVNNAQAQQNTDSQTRINRTNFLGSNSSGNYNGFAPGQGDVPLTADPFTNKAGRDFSLNNNAGGGAAIRGKSFPTSWGIVPDTTNYRDGGAQQHQDSGGGTTTYVMNRTTYIFQESEEF